MTAKLFKEKKTLEGPYNLPKGWRWVRLVEVVNEIIAGFSCPKRYETCDFLPSMN